MRVSNGVSERLGAVTHWDGVLVNPRVRRRQNEITWLDPIDARIGPTPTREDLIELEAKRQYSFQIAEDGSLIQLYYAFDTCGERLARARLAFYKVPASDKARVAWVRIDYDPATARGPLHPPCHMHTALEPASRIPVAFVPGPFQFVEMILAWFYPCAYATRRVLRNGDWRSREDLRRVTKERITCTDFPLRGDVAHVVPGGRWSG